MCYVKYNFIKHFTVHNFMTISLSCLLATNNYLFYVPEICLFGVLRQIQHLFGHNLEDGLDNLNQRSPINLQVTGHKSHSGERQMTIKLNIRDKYHRKITPPSSNDRTSDTWIINPMLYLRIELTGWRSAWNNISI